MEGILMSKVKEAMQERFTDLIKEHGALEGLMYFEHEIQRFIGEIMMDEVDRIIEEDFSNRDPNILF